MKLAERIYLLLMRRECYRGHQDMMGKSERKMKSVCRFHLNLIGKNERKMNFLIKCKGKRVKENLNDKFLK